LLIYYFRKLKKLNLVLSNHLLITSTSLTQQKKFLFFLNVLHEKLILMKT
jgi:hypothetical protein